MKMSRFNYFFFVLLLTCCPVKVFSQKGKSMVVPLESKSRVLIQTIGIRYPDEKDLKSASDLSNYKTIARKYISPCYKDSAILLRPLNNSLTVDSITNCFNSLEYEAEDSVVLILHIVGHGEYDENKKEFYLVCSNGDKLPGKDIKRSIQKMVDKGALVVMFLDACHAGGLFAEEDDKFIGDRLGCVAFYASSKLNQYSEELLQRTVFTQTIFKELKCRKELTLSSLASSIENEVKDSIQTAEIKFLPSDSDVGGFKIIKNPLIKKGIEEGSHIKTDTDSDTIQKVAFNVSLSVGQPLATAFVGATLFKNYNVHGKIEAGVSFLPEREANNVYLYKDNSFSGGYNYTSKVIQPFVRLGAEIDLGKDWSITPLVGLSFLCISGDPVSDLGTNEGKGEKATATCLSSNLRLAWAPFKKKNWQIHATAGYDVGIGDTNYKVLRDNDDVKKMAEYLKGIRGQLGIIYNF